MEMQARLTKVELEEAVRVKVLELLDLPKGSKATVSEVVVNDGGAVAIIELVEGKKAPAVQRRPQAGTVRRGTTAAKNEETAPAAAQTETAPVDDKPTAEVEETVPATDPDATVAPSADEAPFDTETTPVDGGEVVSETGDPSGYATDGQATEAAPVEEVSPEQAAAPKTGSLFASLARS